MPKHARISPSNKRWPMCPGSVREEANYPDIPGEAAIDGTGSHLLLEMCLENNASAVQYDQQIIGVNHPDNPGGWLVGIDRIHRVQMCLDYVTRRVKELEKQYPDSHITVESESQSNPGIMFNRDDWYGTCDITITCRQGPVGDAFFLETIDYKDGRGWVTVTDDSQLLSYMAGKIRPFILTDVDNNVDVSQVRNCRMTIVQPKTNPVVRYQCSTRADDNFSPSHVMAKAHELAKAADACDAPDAPTRSGKHCQWCKANPKRGGHCVTATEKSISVVTDMSNTELITTDVPAFEYISKVVADPKSLTSEQLSELLSAKDALMVAFDNCANEIKERIEAGQHVPGYAMQPGRSSRVWNEPEDVIVKKLKGRRLKLDEIYPKKLISPAALLKLDKLTDSQKKKLEEDLVSTKAGKMTLKKVAHSVVQSSTDELESAQQMFADVPSEISFI